MKKNQALTKEEKTTVIQRGMARLPVMATEALWAFGFKIESDFVTPPNWVRRVILQRFGADPDRVGMDDKIDPVTVAKAFGELFGFAEGSAVALNANRVGSASPKSPQFTEETLRRSIADVARPHIEKFEDHAESVRKIFRGGSVEQYAVFVAQQNEAAQEIAAEEREPGSTSDMTHDLLYFLWLFWPEIPSAGSVHRLHQWISDLDYIHCSEELVEKVCRKAELRLSQRGRSKRIPTK